MCVSMYVRIYARDYGCVCVYECTRVRACVVYVRKKVCICDEELERVCVCQFMHVCTCMCMCEYVCKGVCMCKKESVRAYVCMSKCEYVCKRICVCACMCL